MLRSLSLAILLFLPLPLRPQSPAPAPRAPQPDLQGTAGPDAKSSTAPGNSPPTAPTPGDSSRLEAIEAPKPVYPQAAETEQLQGQVWVKLSVSETGDVDNVDVISGNPILAKAAVEAFKKWKFKPYIRNGHAVKASVKMPMDFVFRSNVTDKSISPNSGMVAPPERVGVGQGMVATPGRVRVGQGIMQGLKIHDVTPIYPEEARQSRIQGTVLLRAEISKDGLISKLDVISGPTQLIPAAIGAVRQWRYKPYILNSEPVEVDTQITVNFTLGGHR